MKKRRELERDLEEFEPTFSPQEMSRKSTAKYALNNDHFSPMKNVPR
jgi:hypothetical protein